MHDFLSVIIPTYNPDPHRLDQTISGLRNQALPYEHWELIIIDNNSSPAVQIDLSWHPNHKIVTEAKQGLTRARLKGFEQASGSVFILVDDDNILDQDYLKNAREILKSDPSLGAIGGKSVPLFEKTSPPWLKEFYGNLALRDMGDAELLAGWENKYPMAAPIGAGMVVRKDALKSYISKTTDTKAIISDRTGNELSSGGDNDMVIEILKSGWKVGYFPSLCLTHIIPEQRMQIGYLARLLPGIQRSWVMVLDKHGINPWSKIPGWTVPARKIKAWFTYLAFLNKVNYVKWRGACGVFEGLAIKKDAKT